MYSSSYIRILSPIPHSALLAALFFLSFLDSLYCVGTPIFQKPQEHNVKLTIFPLENGNITEERNSRDAEKRSKTRPLSPLAHTLSHTPSLNNSHTLTNTLSHTLFLSHTRSLLHTLYSLFLFSLSGKEKGNYRFPLLAQHSTPICLPVQIDNTQQIFFCSPLSPTP